MIYQLRVQSKLDIKIIRDAIHAIMPMKPGRYHHKELNINIHVFITPNKPLQVKVTDPS